jgi:hypothetical protein
VPLGHAQEIIAQLYEMLMAGRQGVGRRIGCERQADNVSDGAAAVGLDLLSDALSDAMASVHTGSGVNGAAVSEAELSRLSRVTASTLGEVVSRTVLGQIDPPCEAQQAPQIPPVPLPSPLPAHRLTQDRELFPTDLLVRLNDKVDQLNSAWCAWLGEDLVSQIGCLTVSDMVAAAYFSCIELYYEWTGQLYVDVVLPGCAGMAGLPLGGVCLPNNLTEWGARVPLHWYIGLVKRLLCSTPAPKVMDAQLASARHAQAVRFCWRGEVSRCVSWGDDSGDLSVNSAVEHQQTLVPAWCGLGGVASVTVQCIQAVLPAVERPSQQVTEALALYIEVPQCPALSSNSYTPQPSAAEWSARITQCLTAWVQIESPQWHLPSPLFEAEIKLLRQALAGPRRIAKWPPLLSLIEQQISRSPLAPAVTLLSEELTLSYEQLSCLANWLAHSCLAHRRGEIEGVAEVVTEARRAPMQLMVCWRLSPGQVLVALLAALKLQVPVLIVPDGMDLSLRNEGGITAKGEAGALACAAMLPGCGGQVWLPPEALTDQALWISDQPDQLHSVLGACALDVFYWPQSEWRDGSREDTPRTVGTTPQLSALLTWAWPSTLSAAAPGQALGDSTLMPITREAMMNQLMATTREYSLGAEDTVLLTDECHRVQMLQMLLGIWLFGGQALVADALFAMPPKKSPVSTLWQYLSELPVTWTHLPESIFCDVLHYGQGQGRLSQLRPIKQLLLRADGGDGFCRLFEDKSPNGVGLWAHRASILRKWFLAQADPPRILLQKEHALFGLTIAQKTYIPRPLITEMTPPMGSDRQASLADDFQSSVDDAGINADSAFMKRAGDVWPRLLDNLHIQVCLPDGRQVPPGVIGRLQVCWPTTNIPTYHATGHQCWITARGEIGFVARAVSAQVAHRNGGFSPALWCAAIEESIARWLRDNDYPVRATVSCSQTSQHGVVANYVLPERLMADLFPPKMLQSKLGEGSTIWGAEQMPHLYWPVDSLIWQDIASGTSKLRAFVLFSLQSLPWGAWPDTVKLVYE